MFNPAQHLLLALGVDPFMLSFGAWSRPRNANFRKKGPGRRHQQGRREEAAS